LEDYQKSLDNNEIREDRIFPVKEIMHDIRYHIMVAKYSAGYPLEEVKKAYLDVLAGILTYWADDQELSKRLNIAAIGVMLEIEDEYFDILEKFIDGGEEKLYMLDYLIHYRRPERKIADKVYAESVFGWIKKATQMEKPEAEAFIAEYLKRKWYSTHGCFYWHDSHKSQVNTYFGYWCFEAGALVKVMGLDDSAFKDNKYYPYDMAHYR
jgi:hypothetical protein